MIPLTRPWTGEEEENALVEVLRSGMLVQGPRVAAFEEAVASAAGRRFGVAVSSGTAALSLALEVAGVGPGDEVLCPALTWPSPAHAAQKLGARVVLVDVDPHEWNATPEALAASRTEATRAAIVIDQFGSPARHEIADALEGLPLIEDAACALGANFANGAACGSLGAVSCFSFHPRKILTTGEGGVCVTDDVELDARLRVLRNHGQRGPGDFAEPGVNLRLGELAGALGAVQMGRLDDALSLRRTHAEAMIAALDGLTFQQAPKGARASHQTLGALVPPGVDPDAIVTAARERGVQLGRLSYALQDVGTIPHDAPLPVARDIAARGIALPLYPQMSEEDRERVIAVVREVLHE